MAMRNPLGLFGRRAPKSGDPLLDAFLPLMVEGGEFGGIAGLLGKFTKAGLGSKANTWVGTGENAPLDPREVELALGHQQVEEIARHAGMSRPQTKVGLAEVIPGLVDKMSARGSIPTGNLATSMKGLDFASILGG